MFPTFSNDAEGQSDRGFHFQMEWFIKIFFKVIFCAWTQTYMCFHMDVYENRVFTPQIIHGLIGFSIIFTIHFGVPLCLETPICFPWHFKKLSPFHHKPTRFWQLVDGISFLQLGLDWICWAEQLPEMMMIIIIYYIIVIVMIIL